MKPNKFQIGEKVKFINEPNSKSGEIVGLSFGENGWIYTIKAKFVDMAAEEVVEGIKTGREDELEISEEK